MDTKNSNKVCTHVKMFNERFAINILLGEKRQTIRNTPKKMPKVYDRISCRKWTGRPYHSKQRILLDSVINEVSRVFISEDIILVNYEPVDADEFSIADGFKNFHDLLEYFKSSTELPFTGILIKWQFHSYHEEHVTQLGKMNLIKGEWKVNL